MYNNNIIYFVMYTLKIRICLYMTTNIMYDYVEQ